MGNCCNKPSTSTPPTNQNTDPAPHTTTNNTTNNTTATSTTKITNRACFGAGCYWGTEKFFKIDFGRKRYPESLIKGDVGFMGPPGAQPNPSYREVCEGTTGHVEVFDMEYSGGEIGMEKMYEELVRFFFQFHDPTTLNRQRNDKGTQYASVIYCYDSVQKEIATRVKNELQALIDDGKVSCFSEKTVTTAIKDATEFFPAHAEHQEYLMKNPKGYCNHKIRFADWP
eukprot:CAMPEP_0185023478 /NCGR_PEP_ID=MMETSP1103-20130426/6146_1 /TAXON_ID=36769 /ORGANISM="Paraphysomonas bandaiensis, Strain Caron Lab Isolate" /LENGTH=226 /DNA_ID=CAMNT_0027556085 /DNA_START=60 /DNA_END=740 /DNA_ORIENTATION=+